MHNDRREQPRYELALPIRIGETRGVTRNLSLDGVLFVSPGSWPVGSSIAFTIHVAFSEAGPAMRLECLGLVTRVEPEGKDHYLTAANITDLRVLTDVPLTRSTTHAPLEDV